MAEHMNSWILAAAIAKMIPGLGDNYAQIIITTLAVWYEALAKGIVYILAIGKKPKRQEMIWKKLNRMTMTEEVNEWSGKYPGCFYEITEAVYFESN